MNTQINHTQSIEYEIEYLQNFFSYSINWVCTKLFSVFEYEYWSVLNTHTQSLEYFEYEYLQIAKFQSPRGGKDKLKNLRAQLSKKTLKA